MNFYPVPPVITAELYLRIPDDVRCVGQESEWRGGFARKFQHIFLEGPVVDSVGNLYMVDIPYWRILRVDTDKNVTVSCKWDGEPNGLVGKADGKLLVADYKQVVLALSDAHTYWGRADISFRQGHSLIRPGDRGHRTASHAEESGALQGPQRFGCRFKGQPILYRSGADWMTDQTGKVYRLSPDGRLDTLVDNGISPNGLVFSLDEKFLFVAMTRSKQVWRLPLHANGTTTKAGVFFQSFGNAGPDGLALDEEGNLFICHPSLGSVFVVDANGIPNARIVSGTGDINLTNCCFGGPDHKTLYLTDSLQGNVQKVEWHCRGAVPAPKLSAPRL